MPMNAKTLLVSLSCGAMLIGCAMTQRTGPTPPPCGLPKCEINVLINGNNVTVDNPELHVTSHNMRIQWNLPDRSEFNLHLGDGVFLKTTDSDQFDDFYPTNDPNAGPPANPHKGKYYLWKNKNSVKGTHQYKIQFHDGDGNPRIVDPTIVNDG
jgi:hypothetical protein